MKLKDVPKTKGGIDYLKNIIDTKDMSWWDFICLENAVKAIEKHIDEQKES